MRSIDFAVHCAHESFAAYHYCNDKIRVYNSHQLDCAFGWPAKQLRQYPVQLIR